MNRRETIPGILFFALIVAFVVLVSLALGYGRYDAAASLGVGLLIGLVAGRAL